MRLLRRSEAHSAVALPASVFLVMLFVIISVPTPLHTQPVYVEGEGGQLFPIPHPDDSTHLWVLIQDSTYVYLRQGGSNIVRAADGVSAAYEFDMVYDDVFRITYTFTECRRNGERLKLSHWKNQRVVNADARLLSFNSTTVPFTCHAGDTLSFYRELYWKDLVTDEEDTAKYYALDSLDFTVELIRLSDSARVATLDTLGILANTVMGPPRIHGTHPLLAVVRYVVPPSLDGVQVCMRLLLFHRGEGEYWFTRTDDITIGYSRHATAPEWKPYWEHFLNVFNPAVPKTTVEQLIAAGEGSRGSSRMLDVVHQAGRFTITFDCAPNGGTTLLGVFDASGQQVYTPYVTTGRTGRAGAEYRYPTSGAYFIALYHDGRLVRVRKALARE